MHYRGAWGGGSRESTGCVAGKMNKASASSLTAYYYWQSAFQLLEL